MARHILLAFGNPAKGKEKEFNDWYETQHIHDILKLPGVVSARRYRVNQAMTNVGGPYQYLAVYDVETDDIGALMKSMRAKAKSGEFEMSDSFDATSGALVIAEATTGPLKA